MRTENLILLPVIYPTLAQRERADIEEALGRHHGCLTHAARELGISARTLQRKLKGWRKEPVPKPPARTHYTPEQLAKLVQGRTVAGGVPMASQF